MLFRKASLKVRSDAFNMNEIHIYKTSSNRSFKNYQIIPLPGGMNPCQCCGA